MSRIKKRDRNLEWLSTYRDLENPGRLKAKQSSNMVFIVGVSIVGIAAIAYVQLMNQSIRLTRQIREHVEYIEDERNKDLYNWHISLKGRSESLINYREGAEKFLGQLKNVERISDEDFRYYEATLREVTSSEAFISGFTRDVNIINLRGVVSQEDMPRAYAEYLTNEKDEEGNPRYAYVEYNGFNKANTGDRYEFSLRLTLWEKVK